MVCIPSTQRHDVHPHLVKGPQGKIALLGTTDEIFIRVTEDNYVGMDMAIHP